MDMKEFLDKKDKLNAKLERGEISSKECHEKVNELRTILYMRWINESNKAH